MFQELAKAFFLIFMAELGDKTQILLMTCAAKYSIFQVLTGIFLGVALNHGLAIAIGMYISNFVANDLLHLFAGIIFIIFGLYSFINTDDEKGQRRTVKCGPVLTVAGTFFLGELGDKTQLTAMTIAMESEYPLLILLGSIAGMVTVGCMGIIIGIALTKRMPSYIIKFISGSIFIIFGCTKLFNNSNLFVCNTLCQGILIVMIIFVSLLCISRLIKNE